MSAKDDEYDDGHDSDVEINDDESFCGSSLDFDDGEGEDCEVEPTSPAAINSQNLIDGQQLEPEMRKHFDKISCDYLKHDSNEIRLREDTLCKSPTLNNTNIVDKEKIVLKKSAISTGHSNAKNAQNLSIYNMEQKKIAESLNCINGQKLSLTNQSDSKSKGRYESGNQNIVSLNAEDASIIAKKKSNCSPTSIENNDYFDNQVQTPVKRIDPKHAVELSEEYLSRRIDTAATDTKSLTTATERKRLGKSASRRKRKNINIRKISKRPAKLKSTKSFAKVDPDNDCIHERVEEENDFAYPEPQNTDLKNIDINNTVIEPEKRYAGAVSSIRNNSIGNYSSVFSNQSAINPNLSKKEKRKLASLSKPVNDSIIMLKSPFEGRPMTVYFPYPDYCGVKRDESNIVVIPQSEFKKQGYSLSFKVTGSTHVYNSIVNSMKNAGFTMITG